MAFYTDEKIALFIDGANLYSAAKSMDFDIDYKKLLDVFRSRGRLIRAYYYTATIERDDYSALRPLLDWLDYNGYHVVTKPAKEFVDREGRKRTKGNMDMEMAVDMLDIADHIDHIVLFSGDGDFRAIVKAVQAKGCRVTVVSSQKTKPPMLADELRRQADNIIDMADMADMVGRARRAHGDLPMVEPDDDDYHE
ncbi:LabA-like NYN domain-containing protein [Robiginitomaculum antarcticum]|uniref:LabA-like NYN domain-containing protein n=1 Tax=Robiginitomaculum antarcticum TaxID=437507 RepID=UPI0003622D11|nr:NYN domain-containing protein [Robiginitomaculum antarcticum]